MISNNPPHTVLELTKEETRWLHALLCKSEVAADVNFRDVCSMSSSDPRARYRVMLQLAANVDQAMSDNLAERLEDQDPKLDRETPKVLPEEE